MVCVWKYFYYVTLSILVGSNVKNLREWWKTEKYSKYPHHFNQTKFQRELNSRKCPVVIPDVYEDFTTEKIITSQWIDGVKLADSSKERIRELIPIGVELFLTQLLDIGAFHAGKQVVARKDPFLAHQATTQALTIFFDFFHLPSHRPSSRFVLSSKLCG